MLTTEIAVSVLVRWLLIAAKFQACVSQYCTHGSGMIVQHSADWGQTEAHDAVSTASVIPARQIEQQQTPTARAPQSCPMMWAELMCSASMKPANDMMLQQIGKAAIPEQQ